MLHSAESPILTSNQLKGYKAAFWYAQLEFFLFLSYLDKYLIQGWTPALSLLPSSWWADSQDTWLIVLCWSLQAGVGEQTTVTRILQEKGASVRKYDC